MTELPSTQDIFSKIHPQRSIYKYSTYLLGYLKLRTCILAIPSEPDERYVYVAA